METSTKIFIIIVILLIFSLLVPSTASYQRPEESPIVPPELEKHYVLQAEITKYSSEEGQTDDSPLITANGEYVSRGTIACPARLAFGTRVEIDGEIYTCNDRMGARYRQGNYFDIWTHSTEEAIEWGRRKREVKILPSELAKK